MQSRLAKEEGIFCEPAAAVSVAAALQAFEAGQFAADARTCCIVTGVGFKDMPSVDLMARSECPILDVVDLGAE